MRRTCIGWMISAFAVAALALPAFSAAEEEGSCNFVVASNSATATCHISPGADLGETKITVKTKTPDGTGPATLRIDYPGPGLRAELRYLNEVNLVLEDDFGYGIWFADMNFDGYIDFAITEFVPAAPNVPHHYWLYDPAAQRYEENQALRPITSPSFDVERKRIRSAWRGSCCNHGATLYEWRRGIIVRVRDAACDLVVKDGVETARFSEWLESEGLRTPTEIVSYEECLARLETVS